MKNVGAILIACTSKKLLKIKRTEERDERNFEKNTFNNKYFDVMHDVNKIGRAHV